MQALAVREYPVDEEGNIIKAGKDEDEKNKEEEEEPEKQEFEGVFQVVDGKAEFVPIETGILGDTEIEVISGLNESTVIVTGSFKTLRALKDGDSVKAKQEEERG
jgi:HlyD family secretion protein